MTANEILEELRLAGNPAIKKIYLNHGAKEPFWGVKIEDLKKIVKKVKKNHNLALELYRSGVSDAMYLAGLIADEKQMTKELLQEWADQAYWYMLAEYPVAWVAAESKDGLELALEWIDSGEEILETAGWATLSSIASITPDEKLPVEQYAALLERVRATIHSSHNRTRYVMNGFVISTGTYIKELFPKAMEVAVEIDKVNVNVGDTSCKVPFAPEYLQKVFAKQTIGKKRKTARC